MGSTPSWTPVAENRSSTVATCTDSARHWSVPAQVKSLDVIPHHPSPWADPRGGAWGTPGSPTRDRRSRGHRALMATRSPISLLSVGCGTIGAVPHRSRLAILLLDLPPEHHAAGLSF